eukprot:jgi/Chrzof1/5078/Cz15g10280.t1
MDVNPFSSDNARHGSFSNPPGPPPPYEAAADHTSIPTGSYNNGTTPTPEAYSKDFEVVVADPVKQGEGVAAYVSYKVRSRTTLPQYKHSSNEVIRRFRDFDWLHDRLAEANKGIIIPPLPDKNAVQKFQMATDFIEERRRALQVFINRVAAHPVLKSSKELQQFLEATEDEWTLEMARVQVQAGGAKKRLDTAMGWIKGIGTATTNLVQGRTGDAAEDPEYIKVRDYLVHLDSHLSEAHRQAARLLRKEQELGEAVAEFGQAIERLGRLEEGNVQEALVQLSHKSQSVSQASKARTDLLAAQFEAPLKEAVRAVKAVQAVCADRATSLAALSAAKHDLDTKKVRWAKLRGTPGSGSDKLAEAERDINEADQRVRNAKIAYEEMVSKMTEELNRFQKERAAELNTVMRDFALTQAGLASDGAKAWGGLLAELQAITGSA